MSVQLLQVFLCKTESDILHRKPIASLTISPELLHSPLHMNDVGKVAANAGPTLSNALCFLICSEGEVTWGFFAALLALIVFFFFCSKKFNFMKFILID